MDEELNYHKIFFNLIEKADKLVAEYEKTIKVEKKQRDDHALVNDEGGGEGPPPSPSSSEISSSSSSRLSNRHHRNASKNPLFKLDVKFDLHIFSGESNVEKLDNWIRQVEVYCCIQQIKEEEAKIQLASL